MLGVRDLFVVAPASSLHHHHHHHAATTDPHAALGVAATGAAGIGVIPLLAAAPYEGAEDRKVHPAHLWAAAQGHYGRRNTIAGPAAAAADGDDSSFPGAAAGGGAALVGTTCQDCGNQAKKDCSHRRCRTCCKSRGFGCPTHVKSTWVPSTRRRERQLAAAAAAASTSTTKKPRLISSHTTATTTTTPSHTSTSNTTPPRSFDSCSSHQDASFRESLPGQIRAPAVFKCVRVTPMDDGEDEYAYQAVVKIGGHVFKGFLYDQGEDGKDCLPNISDLHLGGPGSLRNGASSFFPALESPDIYAASVGGLIGGTGFGNPLN